MARIIRVDGSEASCDVNLESLQMVVGGYIEPIRLKDGGLMYVNEEGRLTGLPPNIAASLLASTMIVGDVVVLDAEEVRAQEGS